jgi:hypothetical protein
MPASNILYNLWVQEDERRARIAYAVEKKRDMDAAEIEPVTSR